MHTVVIDFNLVRNGGEGGWTNGAQKKNIICVKITSYNGKPAAITPAQILYRKGFNSCPLTNTLKFKICH